LNGRIKSRGQRAGTSYNQDSTVSGEGRDGVICNRKAGVDSARIEKKLAPQKAQEGPAGTCGRGDPEYPKGWVEFIDHEGEGEGTMSTYSTGTSSTVRSGGTSCGADKKEKGTDHNLGGG